MLSLTLSLKKSKRKKGKKEGLYRVLEIEKERREDWKGGKKDEPRRWGRNRNACQIPMLLSTKEQNMGTRQGKGFNHGHMRWQETPQKGQSPLPRRDISDFFAPFPPSFVTYASGIQT
ncbi:hypothetical protein NPIL_395031 [Nephila pilipes]|uniref:Uncharacterized protein n=1 Tax=Nephila pilipes TaxID=299642 RepID=A0A8X6TGE7_NEPPI|nr:hypothetical protein NPIL_395031 [Nephila pilipes]